MSGKVVSMVDVLREDNVRLTQSVIALEGQLENALADLEYATRKIADLTDMIRSGTVTL